jgi:hypothetical protein
MGRLVKLKTEEIVFAPARPRAMLIVLDQQRLKEIGSPIRIAPITYPVRSGSAVEVNP